MKIEKLSFHSRLQDSSGEQGNKSGHVRKVSLSD